jgi:serine/threonine-protein kinase RsbW
MAASIFTATFPGKYESLAKIAEFVRQAACSAGFDSITAYQVETAVDEACSNIIEHAYGGEDRGEIGFESQVSDNELVIILRDTGKHFNPGKYRSPDLKAPLQKRDNHGLGLFFIKKLMDEVLFSYDEASGNQLKMVKRKESKD